MTWQENWLKWSVASEDDAALQQQMTELSNGELKREHFYRYLEFGTGGMRGELGCGTNRINRYMIRWVTSGVAAYISEQGRQADGVAIAYDSRHFSAEFALESARVLGAAGIKVYLSDTLRPTPELSFMVRELGAAAGIVITASHNPAEYNGFKVYGADGCQITLDVAAKITAYLADVSDLFAIPIADEDKLSQAGLLTKIGVEADEAYLKNVRVVTQNPEMTQKHGAKLKIVYTPLHGTGEKLVTKSLAQAGFSNVSVVQEQAIPDGAFPTVTSPNPEDHAAFTMAIEVSDDADILMATDPDADRIGVAVKNEQGEYQILTGNQLGAILLHYLVTQPTIPTNSALIKTIVTSDLGEKIASRYGVKTYNTLTGFKFIGEKIAEWEATKEAQFLFGYEESYGYLIAPFVRDKDAIQAALLTAEVALEYRLKDQTLFEGLQEIYEQFGYYEESLHTITAKGEEGVAHIQKIMQTMRADTTMNEMIEREEDYQTSITTTYPTKVEREITLPKSDVLKFHMTNGSWFCIRPSGTEPKCKIYFSCAGETSNEAKQRLNQLEQLIVDKIQQI
ncbi:phospho-sugar mutase [Listeria weihenstephanensis]|uniref:Phosphoglucomutase n=1 Tax=Listeria weihenstephanensis TaxID=1006155 RepID=A0A841Z818_9LIST|nr:phospho-sugar mutase [Listeria weihenstephanensis]MBC1501360.1 phospho-sugar mutase [Listeria weihenstephanensis]